MPESNDSGISVLLRVNLLPLFSSTTSIKAKATCRKAGFNVSTPDFQRVDSFFPSLCKGEGKRAQYNKNKLYLPLQNRTRFTANREIKVVRDSMVYAPMFQKSSRCWRSRLYPSAERKQLEKSLHSTVRRLFSPGSRFMYPSLK